MARDATEIYREVIAERQGEARARLSRFEVKELDLRELIQEGTVTGFQLRNDTSGEGPYLYSDEPGATIELTVEPGYDLNLTFLRHDWAGLLRFDTPGSKPVYLDLFNVVYEDAVVHQISPGRVAPTGTVRLSLHPERNPESHGHQAWLKRAFVTRCGGTGTNGPGGSGG